MPFFFSTGGIVIKKGPILLLEKEYCTTVNTTLLIVVLLSGCLAYVVMDLLSIGVNVYVWCLPHRFALDTFVLLYAIP